MKTASQGGVASTYIHTYIHTYIYTLQSVIGHMHYALTPYMDELMGGIGEDGIPGGALATGDKDMEFYKFWSAILFILCVPQPESVPRAELFGHGALYTGCVMLLVLRQTHRLRNFDFTQHVSIYVV